jgi:hypothetical protein
MLTRYCTRLLPFGLAFGLAACAESGDESPAASGGSGTVLAGGKGGAGGGAGASGSAGTAGGGGAAAGAGGDGVEIPTYGGPPLLSGTGLYANIEARELAADVIEYDVAYPLWTDGAKKARFVALPEGQTIDTTDMDHWVFPVGTRAWKEFWRDGTLVETRYLEKLFDETERDKKAERWQYVAYIWNAAGTDADAAPAGAEDAGGTEHDVPDIETCWQCHNGTRDFPIGISAMQLSGRDGETGALSQFADAGLLSAPTEAEFPMPGTGVVQEALGYLHGNCGYCHSGEHFLADIRHFRFSVRVGDATPEETQTYTKAFGYATTHDMLGTVVVIEPGDPDASQAYVRMGESGELKMPPYGTEIVDDAGRAIIREWIASLPPRTP